jgi:hypothetical protein
MKTNVQPGMLAYVASIPGHIPITPEIVGRIVFVEREFIEAEKFTATDGTEFGMTASGSLAWVISAKEPLPVWFSPRKEIIFSHERGMGDEFLRPLIDPGIDISDREVRELFSPSIIVGEPGSTVREVFARWQSFVSKDTWYKIDK